MPTLELFHYECPVCRTAWSNTDGIPQPCPNECDTGFGFIYAWSCETVDDV